MGEEQDGEEQEAGDDAKKAVRTEIILVTTPNDDSTGWEKELIATVLKSAEIEKLRIEMLAEAGRRKMTIEAEGAAFATRAQGDADAEIILKKGEAEARAMNVKAEAYQEWNQAAVVDKLITGLPEVVKARLPAVAETSRRARAQLRS